ncbi:hypothetical protein RYX36_031094 [Vicia faba]
MLLTTQDSSQQIATENEVPVNSHPSENHVDIIRLENDHVGVPNEDGNNEHGFGVEEEETSVFQIDDEKLEKVFSPLHSNANGSFESSLDNMDLTLR